MRSCTYRLSESRVGVACGRRTTRCSPARATNIAPAPSACTRRARQSNCASPCRVACAGSPRDWFCSMRSSKWLTRRPAPCAASPDRPGRLRRASSRRREVLVDRRRGRNPSTRWCPPRASAAARARRGPTAARSCAEHAQVVVAAVGVVRRAGRETGAVEPRHAEVEVSVRAERHAAVEARLAGVVVAVAGLGGPAVARAAARDRR